MRSWSSATLRLAADSNNAGTRPWMKQAVAAFRRDAEKPHAAR
jgi:hypothetical protein